MNNTDINTQTVNPVEREPAARRDGGIAPRVVFILVLMVTLIAAVHWAMDVTNANTRQITNNINRMQQKMKEDARMSRTPPSLSIKSP